LVAAQLSALSDDPFGPADEGAESGCCGVNLIVVRPMGKGAQFLNESVIPGSYHVQGVSRATRASVIIEEFRTTLFHENLPPMRANPAAGSLSREGRGPICQVEEVEGAIRDCPEEIFRWIGSPRPSGCLAAGSTTQVSNNPDFHDRFFRDSCRKG
jgi:hypothetical protein